MPEVVASAEMLTSPVMRLLVGSSMLAVLLWWTIDRLLGEDDEPSLSIGGDDALFRLSRLPYVGVVAGLGMIPFLPEIMSGSGTGAAIALVFGGLFATWVALEWRENR